MHSGCPNGLDECRKADGSQEADYDLGLLGIMGFTIALMASVPSSFQRLSCFDLACSTDCV